MFEEETDATDLGVDGLMLIILPLDNDDRSNICDSACCCCCCMRGIGKVNGISAVAPTPSGNLR